MSTLALLREWNAASDRAAKAEADRRAALTQRQRDAEDFWKAFHKKVFWIMLVMIPLTILRAGAFSISCNAPAVMRTPNWCAWR